VLITVYNDGPLSIQSDYARKHDTEIAALASAGYITTLTLACVRTRQWRLTHKGIKALYDRGIA